MQEAKTQEAKTQEPKTRDQLIALCKERKIKGYSGKKKDDILKLLTPPQAVETFSLNTLGPS